MEEIPIAGVRVRFFTNYKGDAEACDKARRTGQRFISAYPVYGIDHMGDFITDKPSAFGYHGDTKENTEV